MTQTSAPIRILMRISSQASRCCQVQGSMPTSRRFPPLPGAHEDAAARGVQIAFGEAECLADAKSGTP
jgi:hypothetical protein